MIIKVDKDNECIMIAEENFKQKIYHYIGSFTQAPSFLKDNKFILGGYRINFHTPKSILKRFLLTILFKSINNSVYSCFTMN